MMDNVGKALKIKDNYLAEYLAEVSYDETMSTVGVSGKLFSEYKGCNKDMRKGMDLVMKEITGYTIPEFAEHCIERYEEETDKKVLDDFIISYQRESGKNMAVFVPMVVRIEAENEEDAIRRFLAYQKKKGYPSEVFGVQGYTDDYKRPDMPFITDEKYRIMIEKKDKGAR